MDTKEEVSWEQVLNKHPTQLSLSFFGFSWEKGVLKKISVDKVHKQVVLEVEGVTKLGAGSATQEWAPSESFSLQLSLSTKVYENPDGSYFFKSRRGNCTLQP